MESSLVSIVKDLEQEAERLLQAARAKAASDKAQSLQNTQSLVKKIETEASEETRRMRQVVLAELEKELADVRAKAKSNLDQGILKANDRLAKAVQIILERIQGS